MPDCLLYHFPGSCSRVALIALEQTGAPYRDRGVSLFEGEHHGPEYQALNPKAKVPVLVSDGVTITELPAVLAYLAKAYPAAGLLPLDARGDVPLACWSDMMWLAGGVHPLASRLFRPFMFSEADQEGVKALAATSLTAAAKVMTDRIGAGTWWYGQSYSILDSFVAWNFGVARRSGFSMQPFPLLDALCHRAEQRPTFAAALAREQAAVARDHLALPSPIAA